MAAEFVDYIHAVARQLHLEPSQEREISLELEAHLEDKAAELQAQGLDQQAAQDLAVRGMGSGLTVAKGMYEVHSPGVWRDVLLATVPHFLLAALFALHLWSHYFLVSLLIIGITLVTWKNWRAGNPSKWSYPVDGVHAGGAHHLLAPGSPHVGIRRLDLGHHWRPAVQRWFVVAAHRVRTVFHVDNIQRSVQGGPP